MNEQIAELDGRISEKMGELSNDHLTDHGKLIKTTELTELLKQQNQLLKRQLLTSRTNEFRQY